METPSPENIDAEIEQLTKLPLQTTLHVLGQRATELATARTLPGVGRGVLFFADEQGRNCQITLKVVETAPVLPESLPGSFATHANFIVSTPQRFQNSFETFELLQRPDQNLLPVRRFYELRFPSKLEPCLESDAQRLLQILGPPENA